MSVVSRVEKFKQVEQNTLYIRTRTRVENLPQLIGESYGKLGKYIEEQNDLLTDVPYVAYHNLDMNDLDVEIGFPVSKKYLGKDDIVSGLIPENMAVFCMYRGSYNGVEEAYILMSEWIEKNNFKLVGPSYEYYYNDNNFPEEDYLTKIVMPVQNR